MDSCVESVLITPKPASIHVSCANADEKNGEDLRQEPTAQSHGAAARPESAETKTAGEKNPWSAWAWLGLCKKPIRDTSHIVHVRIDDFFASVEWVLNPKPRPGASVAPGDYAVCAEFAERVGRILKTYTPAMETGARDDFYLDFAGMKLGAAELAATLRRMQAEIGGRTGLRVSIGAARTRELAAMASGLQAGCGVRIVEPDEEEAFLAPLPIERLPGFKAEDAAHFAARGIRTIGQLRRVPRPVLQDAFGKTLGEQLWRLRRGLAAHPATEPAAPATVLREKSISGGTLDAEVLRGLLGYLHARVVLALREQEKQAQAIGVRIEYADSFAASETVLLTSPTCDGPELLAAAEELLRKLFTRRVAVQSIRLHAEMVDGIPQQKEEVSAPGAAWRGLRDYAAAVSGLRWNAAS